MSSKGPGSIPGHSTIFLCYQMNIKCPILTYKDEKPCLPSLPSLPKWLIPNQLNAEIRELCSMALIVDEFAYAFLWDTVSVFITIDANIPYTLYLSPLCDKTRSFI